MIRYRNGAYEVIIYAGVNPSTGRERRVSRTIRMPEQRRVPAEVKQAEAKLIGEVASGQYRGEKITVAELLDVYLAQVDQALSPTTRRGYEQSVRLYLKPELGTLKVRKLTAGHLERLYRALLDRGLSASTIHQAHAIMRRALRQAERWDYVHRNVAALAEVPSVRNKIVEAATPEQVAALLTVKDQDANDLIALAAGTGMRRGEMCGLRWSDLDLETGDLLIARAIIDVGGRISVKLPKSNKVRKISIGPNLLAQLNARHDRMLARAERFWTVLGRDAYILSDAVDGAEPLRPDVATNRFRRHADKLGLAIHLHTLRHYVASEGMANGADANALAAFLGHTSALMTLDTYGHARPDRLRHLANLLDAKLG